ncbi:MAG: dephospho-CoA kinase [Bacteroidota bacterium]
MKRIGLTGNIGTGKSTVGRIFEILGVPVYHADKQARIILASGNSKKQLTALFGEKILDTRNEIDRKVLASIVFNDKDKLAALNNLIHPLVEDDFLAWCDLCKDQDYIIHEAAILFESGFKRLFDAVVLVTAPDELCVKRVMSRDSINRNLVLDRMKNQWTQERKQKLADYIVINDEINMIIPHVLALHEKIING